MRRASERTREREKRGTGHGASYKPWIMPRELHGVSTTSSYVDPITGRQISLLSQWEKYAYLTLRWDKTVTDIREQFPLDLEETLQIAAHYGIRHPMDPELHIPVHMTSDFLVDYSNGRQHVYSIKSALQEMDNARTVEKAFIEKVYWESHNVDFSMWFGDRDIDRVLATNIREVFEYYDPADVRNEYDLIRHMIAHRKIQVDMTVPLDIPSLIKQYLPAITTTQLEGGISYARYSP